MSELTRLHNALVAQGHRPATADEILARRMAVDVQTVRRVLRRAAAEAARLRPREEAAA